MVPLFQEFTHPRGWPKSASLPPPRAAALPTSFHRLPEQRTYRGNVGEQLLGNVVALLQVQRIVVGEPNLSLRVLPEQRFQGQIDRNTGSSLHQGSSALRTAEDEQLGRPHGQPDLRSLAAVIDAREDGDATLPEQRFEALHGFFNAVMTRQVDEPVVFVRTHIDSRRFVALVFSAAESLWRHGSVPATSLRRVETRL